MARYKRMRMIVAALGLFAATYAAAAEKPFKIRPAGKYPRPPKPGRRRGGSAALPRPEGNP